MKHVIMIETDEDVTLEQLHEALCLTVHEGAPFEIPVQDIQVIGTIQDTAN